MATLKELHDLVHVLDKNEKKFITISMDALAGKARDRYKKAFHTINEQLDFDAEKLKRKLGRDVVGMSVSEANNYVYDFICKTIVGYQSGKKLGYTNQLKLIELFVNRKLFAAAHKHLQKLIPELEEHSSFSLIQRAHELQEIITISYGPVNSDYNFREKFFKQRIAATEMQRQNIDFLYLNFRFFQLLKSEGLPRTAHQAKKYLEIWQEPLLHIPIADIHDRTIKIYYILRGALMSVLMMPGADDEIRKHLKDFRQRMKNMKLPLAEIDLLDLLLSNMGAASEINWSELQQIKVRTKELLHDVPIQSVHQRTMAKLIIVELTFYLRKGNFAEGIKYMDLIIKPKERQLWKDAPLAYMIPFTCARIHYLNNDPDKALDYLLMIQDQEKVMRPYFLISYRFLFLLCHYRLKNFQFLDSAITSLTRSLNKLDKMYAPEKAMLQFLRHAGHTDKIGHHLQKLSTSLNAYKSDPYHKIFFEFGDYSDWLKST